MNRRGFLSILGAGAAVAIAPKIPIPASSPVVDDAAIAEYIDLTHKQAAEAFAEHLEAAVSGSGGLYGLAYYNVGRMDNYMGISRTSYPGALR